MGLATLNRPMNMIKNNPIEMATPIMIMAATTSEKPFSFTIQSKDDIENGVSGWKSPAG